MDHQSRRSEKRQLVWERRPSPLYIWEPLETVIPTVCAKNLWSHALNNLQGRIPAKRICCFGSSVLECHWNVAVLKFSESIARSHGWRPNLPFDHVDISFYSHPEDLQVARRTLDCLPCIRPGLPIEWYHSQRVHAKRKLRTPTSPWRTTSSYSASTVTHGMIIWWT